MDLEKMQAPSFRLLVTTPMAAIMSSGRPSNEWLTLLKAIGPVYASIASDETDEVNEALVTVSAMLNGGDELIRRYFSGDDLSFEKMMDVSAKGADVWMCKLSDGEITKNDAIRIFKAIQDGLISVVGDLREENEMIEQFIQVQDKVIDHISSLN